MWVLIVMIFALPFTIWGMARVQVKNEVSDWLAEDSPANRQFRWFSKYFSAEETILLSWEGSALEDPRVERLAEKIRGKVDSTGVRRGGLKQIEAVNSPADTLNLMIRNGVEQNNAIQRMTGYFVGPGRIWCQFSTRALNQKEKSLRLIRDNAMKQFGIALEFSDAFSDPTLTPENEFDEDLAESDSASIATEQSESTSAGNSTSAIDGAQVASVSSQEPVALEIPMHDFQIFWPDMHRDPKKLDEFITWAKSLTIIVAGQKDGEPVLTECFLHRGQPAALKLILSDAGRADRSETLREIRKLAEETGIPGDSLNWSGTPVTIVALEAEVQKAIWNPAAPWYAPHQRSLIGSAWLLCLALVVWFSGNLRHALIVLGISHFATAVILAIISATGGSLNLILAVLPTLLLVSTLTGSMLVTHSYRSESDTEHSTSLKTAIQQSRVPCLIAAGTQILIIGFLMTGELAVVQQLGLYTIIGTALSTGGILFCLPFLLEAMREQKPTTLTVRDHSWRPSTRFVLQHSKSFLVAGMMLLSITLVGLRAFRTETRLLRSFSNESKLVRDTQRQEQRLSGIVPLETVVCFNREAREELNFGHRMEIIREITHRVRNLPEVTGVISLAECYPKFKLPDENSNRKEMVAFKNEMKTLELETRKGRTARPLLAFSESEVEFSEAGDELWRISCHARMMSQLDCSELSQAVDQVCRSVTKYHPGTRHTVTGMLTVFQTTQQSLIDTLMTALLVGTGLLTIITMIVLGDVLSGICAMILNVLPIVSICGIMGWQRIPIDVGSLFTFTVAYTLTITITLYTTTVFRNQISSGASHRRAIVRTMEQVMPILFILTAVIGLPLGMLCLTSFPLLSRFGGLTLSLLGANWLVGAILTPLMLLGPLGLRQLRILRPAPESTNVHREIPEPTLDTHQHKPHLFRAKSNSHENSRQVESKRAEKTPNRKRNH